MTFEPSKSKRNLNKEYQDNINRKYSYEFDYLMHKWIIKELKPHFYGNKNCLELGCYKGHFTSLLSKYFDSVVAVEGSLDLYQELKINLRNFLNIEIVNQMFETYKPLEKFDNIFLVHVLEHVEDQNRLLKRIKKWLSPEGKLFIVVPNARALSRQIAVSADIIEYNSAVTEGEFQHGHRITYSLDTLIHEVKSSGLNVYEFGGIFVKGLANFQLDKAINAGIVDDKYLNGCLKLSKIYPDLCSSIYTVSGDK